MARLHVLRVFTDPSGHWGNPLGVFLEAGPIPAPVRQRIAADLGFSETVFVEGRAGGSLRIHTPAVELAFAGHPTVGTAWLLAARGTPVRTLRPPAGEVAARAEPEGAFVAGLPEWVVPFDYRICTDPDEVDALDAAAADRNVYAWAWLDEAAGIVRARSFVPEEGIEEDEATGSAALALCARLGRSLEIRQGRGSVIFARALDDGRIEIGGRVVEAERREYPLP